MIRLTTHATDMILERGIQLDWIIETLNQPEYRTADPNDVQLIRSFRKISGVYYELSTGPIAMIQ